MKRQLYFLIGWLTCITHAGVAVAQNYYYNGRFYESNLTWQAGMTIGVMNCLTDLGGNPTHNRNFVHDVNWKNSRLAGGLFAGVVYNHQVGLRVGLTLGNVTAFDSVLRHTLPASAGRYNRNLSFETTIMEAALLTEWYPFQIFKPIADDKNIGCPYVLIGIGFYSFSPRAKSGNSWVKLRPLHTEGEGFPESPGTKEYSLHQFNLPLGIGVKYQASGILQLAVEILYRKLFTDYLDDVSKTYIDASAYSKNLPADLALLAARMADREYEINGSKRNKSGEKRGNPENKDAYFSIGLTAAIVLGSGKD